MLPQKQAEEAIVSNLNETEHEGKEESNDSQAMFGVKNLLWHGGSSWDAWFSCASNQVKKQNQTHFFKAFPRIFSCCLHFFVEFFCRLRRFC